ncbi:MAG TPA: sigma-70 family RNA polymerase sigma factor [Phycisphaerae bacterium]|nr:sigma-70 family RNA polymerase sigma factor [Phycisphaerae bacterium]
MLTRTSTTLLAGLAETENHDAWRRFYARYTPMLLSYARRVGLSDADAQDAVSDSLTIFVQKYRAGEYDRERARLKSWLGGIMVNRVRKVLAKRREASLDASVHGTDSRLEPAAVDPRMQEFEREWQLECLHEALNLLRQESDPDAYQAFDLYALKGWPAAKVAAFLGVSANVVYISKTRQLQRLRQIVGELCKDEE